MKKSITAPVFFVGVGVAVIWMVGFAWLIPKAIEEDHLNKDVSFLQDYAWTHDPKESGVGACTGEFKSRSRFCDYRYDDLRMTVRWNQYDDAESDVYASVSGEEILVGRKGYGSFSWEHEGQWSSVVAQKVGDLRDAVDRHEEDKIKRKQDLLMKLVASGK